MGVSKNNKKVISKNCAPFNSASFNKPKITEQKWNGDIKDVPSN